MPETTLTYPLHDAIMAAKAVLPHTGTDYVTPVIVSAELTAERWLATDRFTIGSYAITRPEDEAGGEGSILLDRAGVDWVAKIDPKKLRADSSDYRLTVTYSGEAAPGESADVVVAISLKGRVERSQAFDEVKGNFPPVQRLLDSWQPAETAAVQSLAPVHLEKVTTFAKRNYKDRPVLMEPGNNEAAPSKPGPMRATVGSLTALIQPNLILR